MIDNYALVIQLKIKTKCCSVFIITIHKTIDFIYLLVYCYNYGFFPTNRELKSIVNQYRKF